MNVRSAGWVAFFLLVAAWGGVAAAEGPVWLPWRHWALELYLCEATEREGTLELGFALQPRQGSAGAAVSLGHPRYRSGSGPWRDAVIVAEIDRDRLLRAESGARTFFSIVVASSATQLSLPLGEDDVPLDLAPLRAALGNSESRVPVARPVSPRRPPPGVPARLELALAEASPPPFGDGVLEGGEAGELAVELANRGERATYDVLVRLGPAAIPHVSLPEAVRVARIDPGEVVVVRLPIAAGPNVGEGALRLTVLAQEEFGHDAPPLTVEVATRAAPSADLVLLDDYAVEGSALPVPRDAVVTVRLRVRNLGRGVAQRAVAEVIPGEQVFRAQDGTVGFDLGDLEPGEIAEIDYRCYANRRAESLALRVVLSHDRTRTAPAIGRVEIPLEAASNGARVVRVGATSREPEPLPPAPPPLTSDIDRLAPPVGQPRPDALAVVLGVERYAGAPPATWAAADARTARRYFTEVLGIPEARVLLLVDGEVTLAQFQRIFGEGGWIERRARPESEIFVFFAGHGIAEGEERRPLLVPHDGDLHYARQTAFPLATLLGRLAALAPARSTVFLDACFSGLSRGGEPLRADARPLVIEAASEPAPGIALFAAAGGSEIAHALDEQGHGLFSYWLFRGLAGEADAGADGRVTAGELATWLEERVPSDAERLDREQHPSIALDDPERVLVTLR